MPAKKTTKKVVRKAPAKKSPMEAKVKSFAKNVEKEAKVLTAEGKVIGSKIGTRRERSSTEEKVFMVLGIIALIRGLSILFKNGRRLFISMLLIILGMLLVTGFFSKKKK